MAKNKKGKINKGNDGAVYSEPKYPYSITTNSLRRFLEMVPNKPKPPQVIGSTLKVWGLKNTNDYTILRVLKTLGLLSPSGEPTNYYVEYMKKETGAAILGQRIKVVYKDLFDNITNPEKATDDELKSFFNIHSGGGEATIRYQIETFKALANFATFGNLDPLSLPPSGTLPDENHTNSQGFKGSTGEPVIRIDLHIHLPENKNKSDYDAIMESIANHLYKK